MDFELKTLGLAGAAGEKCDALVMLVAETFKPGKDTLSRLAGDALKARDLEHKPGKLLHAYRSEGIAAARVILAGAGDGSGKRVHAAVQAAVAALRTTGVRRLVICLPADAEDDAVRAAVSATAETSYVYVATKSKPEGRELQRVTIAVADKKRHQDAFNVARAAAEGIEFARELGNLPPNHATPTRLAEEARKLAKTHGFKCEVLGPKEIAKAGHGLVPGRGPGLRTAAPFHRAALPGRGAVRGPAGVGGQRASLSTAAASRSSPRRTWTK